MWATSNAPHPCMCITWSRDNILHKIYHSCLQVPPLHVQTAIVGTKKSSQKEASSESKLGWRKLEVVANERKMTSKDSVTQTARKTWQENLDIVQQWEERDRMGWYHCKTVLHVQTFQYCSTLLLCQQLQVATLVTPHCTACRYSHIDQWYYKSTL